MKNKEIISLYNRLKSANFNNIANGKFQYNLLKNIDNLEKEIEVINRAKLASQPAGLSGFLEKNRKVSIEAINGFVAQKQKEGKTQFFESEIIEVEQKYLSACKGWDVIANDYQKFIESNAQLLDAETEVKLYTFSPDFVQLLELNTEQMKAIWNLIE